jgi:small neutral amino acid transporter SnatA (MarC family)
MAVKKARLKFLNYKLFKTSVARGDGKKLKRKLTLAKNTRLAKKILLSFLFFGSLLLNNFFGLSFEN